MGERDAFGNERGEDTLSGLGWTSGGAVTPEPMSDAAPVPATQATGGSVFPPAEPTKPWAVRAGTGVGAADANANQAFGASTPTLTSTTSIPGPAGALRVVRLPRGLRLFGLLLRVALPVVILLVVGGVIVSVGDGVKNSVNDVRRALTTGVDGVTVPSLPNVPTAPVAAPAGPATAPVGFGPGSLLKAGNLKRALALLRSEGSRARSLRVAPERIDATIVTASGFIRQVQVTWEGKRTRFSQTGPGFTQASTYALADLDAGAPARLTRSAVGRAKSSPSKMDYLVAIPNATATQGWVAFLKDGKGRYLADAHGRITRRIG